MVKFDLLLLSFLFNLPFEFIVVVGEVVFFVLLLFLICFPLGLLVP